MTNALFTSAELMPRLLSDFRYPQPGAQLIASKLIACDLSIQKAFWEWWQSGVIPLKLEVAGFSMERLIREHEMKPIAAFLTLDWLLREPEKAKKSLQKGHDQVLPRK
jgi:hypothetical protein